MVPQNTASDTTGKTIAEYMDRGWNVIPLRRETKRPAFGKDELRPHLYQRPDRETVREWYKEGRFGGVGIVTGPTSGIVVLDVDGEEGKALLKKHGHAPTPMVQTSKGLHLYFTDPGGDVPTCIRFAPDLDLKAGGGYVAAPPTAGREWIIAPDECPLADLPGWVIERIRLRGSRAKFEWGEDIPNGERNKRLTSLAGKLRYAGLDARSILSSLITENDARCKPPLDDAEVRKIAESVGNYEPGSSSSSSSPLYTSDDDDDGRGPELVWFSGMGKPEPRQFLIDGVVPRNHPTVFHGWSGTAKSILVAHLAMSIAGRRGEWLGHEVRAHGKVLFLDFELDAEEQHRRVHELAAGMGIAVPDDLAYLSALGVRTGTAFARAFQVCREQDFVAVVIDSLGPAMLGDMETAKDVIGFHNTYIAPFRKIGVTPIIVDHQGKLQAGENYQSKGAFGSAYKEHLARSIFQIEPGDREPDVLNVRIRHRKTNFGPKLDPFDVRLSFGAGRIETTAIKLDAADLVAETTMNATDRVLMVLEAGPSYPDEIAEQTGLAVGTVSNCITKLKNAGKVEYTGERQGKAQQVRLSSSPSSSSSSFGYRENDDDDDRDGLFRETL
ncbi:MAG: bifunctional DNA primase/polymerase [Actinomycetota bacterium]|nr:bifunctional DNA primase/polymerase [Actinomycetota bacterium]